MRRIKLIALTVIILIIIASCGNNKNEELLTNGIWGKLLDPKIEIEIESKSDSAYYTDFHFGLPFVFREDGTIIKLNEDGYEVVNSYEVSGNEITFTLPDTIIEENLEYGYLEKYDTIPVIETIIVSIIEINDSVLTYELIGGENIVVNGKILPLDSVIGNIVYFKKIYDLERMKYYLTDDWYGNNKYAE